MTANTLTLAEAAGTDVNDPRVVPRTPEENEAWLREALERAWGPDPVLPGRAPVKEAETPEDGPALQKAHDVVARAVKSLSRKKKKAKTPDEEAEADEAFASTVFAVGVQIGEVLGWLDRVDLGRDTYPLLNGDINLIHQFDAGVKKGAETPRDLRQEVRLADIKAGKIMVYNEEDSEAEKAFRLCDDGARAVEEMAELVGRLVLTDATAKLYWIWHEKKKHYTGPYAYSIMRNVLQESSPVLATSYDIEQQVRSKKKSEKGADEEEKDTKEKKRTPPTVLYNNDILREASTVFQICGKVVDRVEYVAGLDKPEYDRFRNTLRVGVAQFRTDLKPSRCEAVKEWLALLGGEQTPKLLDWLATFRQVTRPTCALYVEGVSSAGKELLARGLSQLYVSRQYCRYEEMVDSFNDLLLDSSLVYADEKMPDQGMKRGAPSAVFRSLTATDSFTINAKHAAKVSVRMCPRILITANDSKALNLLAEGLEQDSVEAIAKRILHVCPKDRLVGARDYLKALGGRRETEKWVDGDLLARHILWLEQNHEVKAGDRFIVEGGGESVTRLIVGREMDRVLEALAIYCSRYKTLPSEDAKPTVGIPPRLARSKGVVPEIRGVFVQASALADYWTVLLPREKVAPSSHEIGRMLANLSGKRIEKGGNKGYIVPKEAILECAELLGIGDSSEMKKLFSTPDDIAKQCKAQEEADRLQADMDMLN